MRGRCRSALCACSRGSLSRTIGILLGALVLVAAFLFVALRPGGRPIPLTLVLTGVLQGNLAPLDVVDRGVHTTQGGIAFLTSAVAAIRAEVEAAGGTCLHLDLGDDLPGTGDSFYTQGKAVVEAMNLLAPDAILVGNREFDYGLSILEKRAAELKPRLLAANVLGPDRRVPAIFKPSLWFEVNGVSVEIVGMAPPTTPQEATPRNVAGLTFQDETETVALYPPKADFTIYLTQRDMRRERADVLRLTSAGVDLVVAFDYERAYENLLVTPEKRRVAFLHGLSKGTELTRVDLAFDGATRKVVSAEQRRIPVGPARSEPDNRQAALLSDLARRLEPIKGRVLGHASVLLDRPYNEETNLGDLTADVMRAQGSAEIALQNSGSFREAIPAGPITAGKMYNVMPFDNEIVSMTLTGKDIAEILEKTARDERGILQIGGASYRYRSGMGTSTAPVLLEVKVGSAPIDPARDYRVATNTFLAGGGGGYKPFLRGRDVRYHDRLRDALCVYIESRGTIEARLEGRISKE